MQQNVQMFLAKVAGMTGGTYNLTPSAVTKALVEIGEASKKKTHNSFWKLLSFVFLAFQIV